MLKKKRISFTVFYFSFSIFKSFFPKEVNHPCIKSLLYKDVKHYDYKETLYIVSKSLLSVIGFV